ncbi:hypothetical protein ACU87_25120 [Escherichia coli]|nr:hypothetical protein ACU87_25120 [Escherichia coli]
MFFCIFDDVFFQYTEGGVKVAYRIKNFLGIKYSLILKACWMYLFHLHYPCLPVTIHFYDLISIVKR